MGAFEALYARYHLTLLSFARHMLGRAHDAEDVVQHTFLAADSAFRAGKVPASVRAWLYTVARNRCISVLRMRREDHDLPGTGVRSTEDLASEVEHREDLRELLADLRALPEDQRAALLLAELGDLSHADVAAVIGVRAGKVKALVFQARQTLMAAADARAIPCRSIRRELATATGSAGRRRHLRDHVARCDGCAAFSARVHTQRSSLAAILPVVPTVALREGVFAGLGAGTGAAAAAGGASTGIGILAAKSTAAKLLTIAAMGGAAGGGALAVGAHDPPGGSRPVTTPGNAPAVRSARSAPSLPAITPAASPGAIVRFTGDHASVDPRRRAAAHRRAPANRSSRRDRSRAGRPPDVERHGNGRSADHPGAPPGRALGPAGQQAPGRTPPGQRGANGESPSDAHRGGTANAKPAGPRKPTPPDPNPASGRPDAPDRSEAAPPELATPVAKPAKGSATP